MTTALRTLTTTAWCRRINLGMKALAACLLAGLPMSAAYAAEDEPWDWKIAPLYIWAPSVTTDLRSGLPPVESETSFSDVINKIDMVFTLHAEGQGDAFGLLTDINYLALSDDKEKARYSTDTSFDLTVLELAGVWSPGDQRYQGFEAIAGLRRLDAHLDVAFDPVNPALANASRVVDRSFNDFMIGGRYTTKLSERWSLSMRADTSFGDTEGTYALGATLAWRRSERGAWLFGYKYMQAKFEGGGEGVKVTEAGPVVGYSFEF